ncbi:uncharacterized protein L969DRAFT_26924, partial [Mixia osmundae IAM 14324]|uniref:uncharacterized protein n=1 Tax=Mixia osmundae (strain CBS 9802 / IAM 14324 / JCM 22182 / KY 12970) TaxID=764103 RepID=UPI0004A54CAE
GDPAAQPLYCSKRYAKVCSGQESNLRSQYLQYCTLPLSYQSLFTYLTSLLLICPQLESFIFAVRGPLGPLFLLLFYSFPFTYFTYFYFLLLWFCLFFF